MARTTLARQIGRRISKIRRQRGMTSERLAYENDISKGYLSDIENGKRVPSVTLLDQIARALDVRLKDLFDF
jgi:transcriptional regulator with XRE-family HTH domain